MDKNNQTTEERILAASKKVFHTRGFDGARMQEIANEAGVNKSLVHYYFRNKESLFKSVFEDAFGQLLTKMNEVFFSDLPIIAKIETFLHFYLDFLAMNSYLPWFILKGLHERPGQLKELMDRMQMSPQRLINRIHDQVKEELNIEIDPLHFFINMLSLSIFPFLARPLILSVLGYSPEMLGQFYEERKTKVPEFILNALKGYENYPSK